MQSYYDYVFYKIHKYYSKFKVEIPIAKGIGFIGVINILAIWFYILFVNLLIDLLFNKNYYFPSSTSCIVFYCVVLGGVTIYSIWRYANKKKRTEIITKYEQKGKDKFKTWQVFLIPIVFIGLTVCLFVVAHWANIKNF